jgi:type IV secretory pathway TraG/TraD family ATPase VirD4
MSKDGLLSPDTLALLGAAGFMAYLSISRNGANNPRKKKLGTSQFGGKSEMAVARKAALAQMKARKHNEVGLEIGEPSPGFLGKDYSKSLLLPNLERGTLVVGQPGSGKTYSTVDPLLRSAIRQGFPIMLYDYKYPDEGQAEAAVGYAVKHGYKVHIFAPTFPESQVVNILDFLKDQEDSENARQLAEVINSNFDKKGSKEDGFFSDAGKQLTQAILQITCGTAYSDIIMAQSILGLKKLPDRVHEADLNPWVKASFSQFISLSDSEKTVASIAGTANRLFSRFMMPSLLNAFCGETTLPLYLEGKQIVVFGMNRKLRDVLAPLMAAIIHMMVTINTTQQRKDPLVLSLDEAPTLYLPSLKNWLNELRSKGLVSIVGIQNLAQLQSTYGKEDAQAIVGACATKFIFNTGDYKSAEEFANMLGEKQVDYQTRSSGSSGGKGSSNVSEQVQARKLFEPAQFLRLIRGHCIILSPGFCRGREGSIPIKREIVLPKHELIEMRKSSKAWPKIRQKLGDHYKRPDVTGEDIKLRTLAAQEFLPEPPDEDPSKKY